MDAQTFLKHVQASSFQNVNVSDVPLVGPIEGWMAPEFVDYFGKALQRVLHRTRAPVIVEVGTWKGLSANTMASLCRAANVTPQIVCIDTWLGSPEHMEGESSSQGMSRINGLPTLFAVFLKNTKRLGNDSVIYPFPISSVQGAHYLIRKNFVADIIYIDAGHEYESVLLDIKLFWQLLQQDGVMIFDDWRWPGVRKAIQEFAGMHAMSTLVVGELQAYMIKKD
jgi:hypothetical protein